MSQATACIKCVLPKPTPPNKKRGLKVTLSLYATLFAAAKANSFDFPTTKTLKLNLGSIGEGLLSDIIFLLNPLKSSKPSDKNNLLFSLTEILILEIL